ncbi:uncharacterized protein B0H64DRAFT_233657 [Chaetomium fimeti]|uniref:Mid2 domain-containing protein n=1 Tax=Chaetomium fimeti TaxID=1854472 RepID=A0AAE0LP40_9PEZI|nr:hypothetical protein B0H64DRAFT_233657 [Chaetomium fimeti]
MILSWQLRSLRLSHPPWLTAGTAVTDYTVQRRVCCTTTYLPSTYLPRYLIKAICLLTYPFGTRLNWLERSAELSAGEMPPGPSLQYERSLSLLLGREVMCADIFGSEGVTKICSPSLTRCCARRGEEFPSCQESLGKGWCCDGTDPADNCFVDQSSACEEPDSVPCANLAEGTSKACCPRLTTCAADHAASVGMVRCNMQYFDLQRAAEAPPSSSSARTTTSPASSSISTSSTGSTELSTPGASSGALLPASSTAATSNAGDVQQTPLPSDVNSQGQGTSELSAGLIAGAAVGGTLGFVALLVLGYLFLRKLLKSRQQSGHPPPPGASESESQPEYGHHDYSQTTMAPGPPGYGPTELPGAKMEPVELPAACKPSELH